MTREPTLETGTLIVGLAGSGQWVRGDCWSALLIFSLLGVGEPKPALPVGHAHWQPCWAVSVDWHGLYIERQDLRLHTFLH